jgi:CRP-like cAMP-binding protein
MNATSESETETSNVSRELFLLSFMGVNRVAGVSIGNAFFRTLARTMRDVYVRAGEVIYREGDRATDCWFIERGEVVVTKEGLPPRKFGERSIIGIFDATMSRPRQRTATATRDTHLLQLRTDIWFHLLEENFELARGGMMSAARNVLGVMKDLAPKMSFTIPGDVTKVIDARRGPLNLVDKMLCLRTIAPFRDSHMQAITQLAELAEEVRLDEGQMLFEPNDSAERTHLAPEPLYALLRGKLAVTGPEDYPLRATFSAPSLLFPAASTTGDLLRFSVQAAEDSILLSIGYEDFIDVLEEHFDAVRATFVVLNGELERLIDIRNSLNS